MNKWSYEDRTSRFLGLGLAVVGLSFLLPDSVESYVRWLASYLQILFIAGLGGLAYLLFVWRPVISESGRSHILGAVLAFDLVPAILVRFWAGWHPWYVVTLWGLISAGLVGAYVESLRPSSNRKHRRRGLRRTWSLGKVRFPYRNQFVVDTPQSRDKLGRKALARILARTVSTQASSKAVILAINGPWGSGKSTVMKLMERELTTLGHKSLWVNAWIYNNKAGIWQAVIKAIVGVLKEHHLLPLAGVKQYYKVVGEVVKASVDDNAKPIGALLANFPTGDVMAETKGDVSRLIGKLVGPGKKLVVFIDDLDRCAADSVIGTLEFLKEVTDFSHTVFVLGMDNSVVAPMLDNQYRSGQTFLQKVINVSIDLNAITPESLAYAYANELQRVTGLSHKSALSELEWIATFVDCNPRSMKLLMNGIIIVRQVLGRILDGYTPEEYVRDIIGAELIRLRYPSLHSILKSPDVIEQLERKTEAARLEVPDVKGIDWTWVTRVYRYRSPRGPFVDGDVPRHILFSYAEHPGWIPESEIVKRLELFRSSEAEICRSIGEWLDQWPADAEEFVSRVYQRKKRMIAGNPVFQPTTLPDEHALYRRFFASLVEGLDSRRLSDVLNTTMLRRLMLAEIVLCCDGQNIPYVRSILNNIDLPMLGRVGEASRESGDPLDDGWPELRSMILTEVWCRFLRSLGQSNDLPNHAEFEPVLQFRFAGPKSTEWANRLLSEAVLHKGDWAWFNNLAKLLDRWTRILRDREDSPDPLIDVSLRIARQFIPALNEIIPLAPGSHYKQALQGWDSVLEKLGQIVSSRKTADENELDDSFVEAPGES